MFTQSFRRLLPLSSIHHLKRAFPGNYQNLRMASTLPKFPVFEAIAGHDPQSTVVVHCKSGRTFLYGDLLRDVAEARDELRQSAGSTNIEGQRVAFLVENGYDYVGAAPLRGKLAVLINQSNMK